MKKLAVIGASYLQLPLVVKARENGLRVLCFARDKDAVCKEAADVFYPISIVEKEEILDICRKEKIDGICTIASDVAAPTVAYVAGKLGLPGNTYEAACRANNKYQMREAFNRAGVPCPQYRMVTGWDASLNSLPLPLIVKPSDRSGSLGVTKVERVEELQPAVERALACSFKHEAMVEEFVSGREISVEFISCGGKHYPLAITDKVTTEAPHFVELQHHQPSTLPADMYRKIYDITQRALDALGLTDGASHSEYKITPDGRIAVMEIGGRMGGDFIGSDLVHLSTGYDFVQGVVDVALGRFEPPVFGEKACAGVYFLCRETARLQAVMDRADDIPEVVRCEQTDRELRPVACSADRSGYIIYRSERKWVPQPKRIMILGGGYYQLPLIQQARRMGLYTIVCGIAGHYPGYAEADLWLDIDVFDREAVLRAAREQQIDGLLVCGTDAVMPVVGYVCDCLHLTGPSLQAAVNASDKAFMKAAFQQTGVRTAAYQMVKSPAEALDFAHRNGYPVVLKVVDASGSKGVNIVHDDAELQQAYKESNLLTHKDYRIVEVFVKGEEFGAQAFVRDGRLVFVMPHGDEVFHAASDVPVGHYVPYEKSSGLMDDIRTQLERCVRALGIDNTAINADFILSDGQVYVLEIGARAGATCLPELVGCYYGINY